MELNRAMRLIEGAQVLIETHEGVMREGRVTQVRRRTIAFKGFADIEVPEGIVLDNDPADVIPIQQVRNLTCDEVVRPRGQGSGKQD